MNKFSARVVRVSAPGKLMLLGEHAVVHQRSCLVTAMDTRLFMTLALAPPHDKTLTIHAPDVKVQWVQRPLTEVFEGHEPLIRGTRFIERAVAVFGAQFGLTQGVRIITSSDFDSTLGLGSSSATVACTLYGLSQLLGIPLSPRELFDLGLQAVLQVQQKGSGFDLAAAIYGGTVYYANFPPREIMPLDVPGLPLVVAYSGIKADTDTYVGYVNQRLEHWPDPMMSIFDAMQHLVFAGRDALTARNWAYLGELMNIQHGLAHAIGVDTPELANLIFAAREAGAYGAKLSGAGGGDCVIALAPPEKREAVEQALAKAGGEIVKIAPHAAGVRLELMVR